MNEIAETPKINGDFTGKDIIAINQFTPEDVDMLFKEADAMQSMLKRGETSDILAGKMIDLFFYQPSTRTVISFEKAAKKLGAAITKTSEVQYSSVSKGENLQDTMRTLESTYSDAIVLRHKEIGSATLAASKVGIPIINGGDGPGEHPTQALLDLYTIKEERGEMDNLNITFMGDLKYGRTVHSLARLTGMFGGRHSYVSPASLRLPKSIHDELDQKGVKQRETQDLSDVLADTDILYMTRVQKEYFKGIKGWFQYRKAKGLYVITPETMAEAPEGMSLMHPFPRVGEIDERVDDDLRAAYFREISHGVHLRGALLAMVLGKSLLKSNAIQAKNSSSMMKPE